MLLILRISLLTFIRLRMTGILAMVLPMNNQLMGVIYSRQQLFTMSLIATNSLGCAAIALNPTVIYPLPVVGAGPDVTICPGTDVAFSGSGALSYSWNNGISDGVSFEPLTPNTYTVTGTDGNGCINTDEVQVFFYTDPVVEAGSDVVLCNGQM